MASKYMLAIGRKHVFNPAAIAVVLTGLGAGQTASWWVGTASMLPFVLFGGLLMMRKVRKFQMAASFVLTSYIATIVYIIFSHGDVLSALQKTTLSSALFFLAFVMLTEPITSPRTVKNQRWYGILTGLLFPPQVHLGSFFSTPELALAAGNIFSYIVSPQIKIFPLIKEKIRLAPGLVDFVFAPQAPVAYQAGQYMELTLPHEHPDSRGDRRYFTLASSPTESDIRFGVKFYAQGSSYKNAMLKMNTDSPVVASQLSGDFVLPEDKSQKLVFIAGGIGITPYRSMVKYLLDTNDKRTATLLYSAQTSSQIVYTDVFEEARQRLGTNVVYCITHSTEQLPGPNYIPEPITADLIRNEVPDFAERLFYIAGSHNMVRDIKKELNGLGVSNSRIKIDFFPGYS
jgi:ferredoxin-NADP reductase